MLHLKIKYLLPFVIIFFLTIFLSVPNNFLYFGTYTPEYILAILFYYLVFKSKSLPLSLLVLLGLIYDLTMKYPLGSNIAIFLCLKYFLNLQYKFLIHRNFYTIWLFFILDLILVTMVKLALLSIIYNLSNIDTYLGTAIKTYFTILLYPSIHFILARLNNLFDK